MPERETHTIRVTSMNIRSRQRAAPPLLVGNKRPEHARYKRSQPSSRSPEIFHIGERLLRDCALCTAAVLCVLALGNVQQPWAQSVSSTVRDAVTMDLDESLGRLQFVQNILPESALVFWNVGNEQENLQIPASGRVIHAWKQTEPWIEYACEAQSVVCAASGEVMSITQGTGDAYMIRIRHETGTETLYGELVNCIVREGDTLQAGQIIGTVADSFFFEARRDGRAINPTNLLRAR